MKQFLLVLSFVAMTGAHKQPDNGPASPRAALRSVQDPTPGDRLRRLHAKLRDPDLDATVLAYALRGHQQLRTSGMLAKEHILSILDYTLSANRPRFFVIDLEKEIILYKSLVAHGKNSGLEFADKLSNRIESLQSSLGFFVTGETYQGKHGYSLRIDGVEYDFNHHARVRNIVIHEGRNNAGEAYVSKAFIHRLGRLGRSDGCPALEPEQCKAIIDAIHGKSCLFAYYPDPDYFQRSPVLKPF
ncbi:MAG: murein L,D-transpeptidase catalytic domain family protein [Ferruginibacter sp.]|nr:murein L,D-transpeptidase catalytic domain family protein [Cytophagales bacterium]